MANSDKRSVRNTLCCVIIMIPILLLLAYVLFFKGNESNGELPSLSVSRTRIELNTKILKNALKDNDWCEITSKRRGFIITSTNYKNFKKNMNYDSLVKIAEDYPEIFSISESSSQIVLTLERHRRLLSYDYIIIPTCVVCSLLDNNILQIISVR